MNEPAEKQCAVAMSGVIYKLCERAAWEAAKREGAFIGSAADLRDGFIHFSTAAQLRETAAKHFAGIEDLVLVAVDSNIWGDRLKWEISRGGDLFPHLYGPLPVAAVLWAKPLALGRDGGHIFPEQLA